MKQLLFTPPDRLPTDAVRVETHRQRRERVRDTAAVLVDLIVEREIERGFLFGVWWAPWDGRFDCTVGAWHHRRLSASERKRIRTSVRRVSRELGLTPMMAWRDGTVRTEIALMRRGWGGEAKCHPILLPWEVNPEAARA